MRSVLAKAFLVRMPKRKSGPSNAHLAIAAAVVLSVLALIWLVPDAAASAKQHTVPAKTAQVSCLPAIQRVLLLVYPSSVRSTISKLALEAAAGAGNRRPGGGRKVSRSGRRCAREGQGKFYQGHREIHSLQPHSSFHQITPPGARFSWLLPLQSCSKAN